jgi:hypothetical protein
MRNRRPSAARRHRHGKFFGIEMMIGMANDIGFAQLVSPSWPD